MKTKVNYQAMVLVLAFFAFLSLVAVAATSQLTGSKEVKKEYIEEDQINPYYNEINALEDCIEWMQADAEQGLMEGFLVKSYTENLEEVIKVLQNTPQVSYKQHQYNNKEEYSVDIECDGTQ